MENIINKAIELPDPYSFRNGDVVTSPAKWEERAKEISELYQENMYGRFRNGEGEYVSYETDGITLSIIVKRGERIASFCVNILLPDSTPPF